MPCVARIDDCAGSFDRVDLVAVERPRRRSEQPISFVERVKEVVRGPSKQNAGESAKRLALEKVVGLGVNEVNDGHKGYGRRGVGIQALVEKKGARKSECPEGQAKAGRKQGEARLLI